MTVNSKKSQAFKLKGRLYTLTVLQIISSEMRLLSQQLSDVISQAPKLFENAPVVLDFSVVKDSDIDVQQFCQILREQGIVPVAIQNASPLIETVAHCQGLAVLNSSSTQDKVIEHKTQEKKSVTPVAAASKLYTVPIRSGQQVVAKNSDLVVVSSVSHGAELLADGNIHVYGALRGRALAGISGNSDARIFCQSLEAELVSIAGYYRLSDAMDKVDGPCQIFLNQDQIQIEPL